MNTVAKLVVAACLLLPLSASVATACPLCKEAIPEANDGATEEHDPERLGRAYNYSIFLVLAIMLGLMGSVGFLIYRGQRQVGGPDQLA